MHGTRCRHRHPQPQPQKGGLDPFALLRKPLALSARVPVRTRCDLVADRLDVIVVASASSLIAHRFGWSTELLQSMIEQTEPLVDG